jgi:hypothetical protein
VVGCQDARKSSSALLLECLGHFLWECILVDKPLCGMLSTPGVSLLCTKGSGLALLRFIDSRWLLRLTTHDDSGLHIMDLGLEDFSGISENWKLMLGCV